MNSPLGISRYARRTPKHESETPWGPIAIGAAAILIVLGLVFFLTTRNGEQKPNSAPDPYAANLAISDLALSTAENFAGQEVTYLEGAVKNNGEKTVNGITVQVAFKNSLGQVVQNDSQPLMAITARQPYIDTASLKNAPLRAGQGREFRLTFEHISADWDRQMPEVRILKVSTQ